MEEIKTHDNWRQRDFTTWQMVTCLPTLSPCGHLILGFMVFELNISLQEVEKEQISSQLDYGNILRNFLESGEK